MRYYRELDFKESINALHENICKGQIMDTLEWLIKEHRVKSLCYTGERANDIKNDYSLLLQYYVNGSVDPQRQEMLSKIKTKAHNAVELYRAEVAERADEGIGQREIDMSKDASGKVQLEDLTFGLTEVYEPTKKDYAQEEELYAAMQALTCRYMSAEDVAWVREKILNSAECSAEDKAFAVSSLSLNMIYRFNQNLAYILIEQMDNSDSQIAARATVGILLSLTSHTVQWTTDKTLMSTLRNDLEQHPKHQKMLQMAYLSVVQTIMTKAQRNANVENFNERMERLKEQIENMQRDNGEIEISDLEEIFGDGKDKNVLNYLKKVSEWLQDGCDIGFKSYKMLKTDRFFNEPMSWIRPFDKYAYDLNRAVQHIYGKDGAEEIIGLMSKTLSFCDSDKYSILLSMDSMPRDVSEQMKRTLIEETKRFDEMLYEREEESKETTAIRWRIIGFVHDLYRLRELKPSYCNLSEIDPQKLLGFMTEHNNLFRLIYTTSEEVDLLGRKLVDYELWVEAAKVYDGLIENQKPVEADWLRKYALCVLKQEEELRQNRKETTEARNDNRNTTKAEKYLRKADLIEDDNSWTKIKLAEINYYHRLYDTALYYLESASQIKTLRWKESMMLIECALRCGEMQKAQKFLSAFDSERESEPDVMRMAAEHEILAGNLDEALWLMDDMKDTDKTAEDNMRHIALLLSADRVREAAEVLERSKLYDVADNEYMRRTLALCGVEKEEWTLLIDGVRIKKQID